MLSEKFPSMGAMQLFTSWILTFWRHGIPGFVDFSNYTKVNKHTISIWLFFSLSCMGHEKLLRHAKKRSSTLVAVSFMKILLLFVRVTMPWTHYLGLCRTFRFPTSIYDSQVLWCLPWLSTFTRNKSQLTFSYRH